MNVALTRHFFQDFFRLSFLDDAGEESFKRVIIGLLGGFIALGLWLPRMYIGRYVYASSQGSFEHYRALLLADELLMIGLPMFIVALAMALVCHSLFPDEIDYRILMALPVRRSAIFSAKAAALFLFATIFIVTTNAAMGLPFSAVSAGRLASHSWPLRAVAQMTAGVAGGVFSVAAIVALQGLVVVVTPRAWLRSTSVAVQTLLVCTLVLLLPFVLGLPAQAARLHARSLVFFLVPPAWFLGIQELILDNREPYFVRLALLGAAGFLVVCTIAAGCYAAVYRRFDRVILRSERKRDTPTRLGAFNWSALLRPEAAAVHAFTVKTLRRSGLHQLVFLGLAAAGLAFALNSVSGAASVESRRQAVLWSPFVVIFASCSDRGSLCYFLSIGGAPDLSPDRGRRPVPVSDSRRRACVDHVCGAHADDSAFAVSALGSRRSRHPHVSADHSGDGAASRRSDSEAMASNPVHVQLPARQAAGHS